MLPSGALPVFPNCPSSVCSRRSATYISSLPQQCSLQQEPSLLPPPSPSPPAVFFTAAAVPALAGTFSIFHCRSSACSSRILLYFSPLPQQRPLPQEHLPFLPTTAVVSAPAGALSPFSTAAAVTAPAGALPIFSHYRSSECSPQERYLYFLTAPAVSAPAGALPIFPHCRSSARSSRSLFPQPLPVTQPPLYFLTAAAVLAPAGAPLPPLPPLPPSIFSLPQQCLLQQEPPPPPPPSPLPNSPHATMGIPPQLFSSLPQ